MKQSNKNKIIATNDRTRPQLESKSLRTRPRSLSSKELQELLNLDRLMCPRQSFLCHYEIVGTRILKCLDTGLLWQREGAGFSLNWQNACEYIDYLNEQEWQGHRHWRLPTIEELGSLLCPPDRMRKLCVDSYIAGDIHWLWSCDTSTRKKSWAMDMPEGYFLEVDKDAMASICAVATST
jgi:serine/threonine-protein kinase